MTARIAGVLLGASLFVVPATAQTAEDAPKVGFLLKTMQEERYERDRRAFTAKVESLGGTVLFESADNDAALQGRQLRSMLQEGIDVLVIQPVDTGQAGLMIKQALDQEVKVVGYDSIPLNSPLDFMVMQDSWAVGRIQFRELVSWLQRTRGRVGGRIALIRGAPGDSNAGAMSAPIVSGVADYPALEIVVDESHEAWSPEAARRTAADALRRYDGKIDAFLCNNSGLARGVLEALETRGLADADRVYVAGADADLANVRAVARGAQALEIWKPIEPLAHEAAEVAIALVRDRSVSPDRTINNGFKPIPTIVTPVTAVTRSTIEDTVIAGGFYTREQVFGVGE
ncbi:MAG: substrate-binding domain-containing protein [Thermoanaerobaculia bacterium]|nr:substrate-binding domain-containing protein [Thermoanaerobaculia bacterium]